ncbi:MAG: nitroreductase family protein [Bacteroidota bacterium]
MSKIKSINGFEFEEYNKETYPESVVVERSRDFYQWLNKRRTVRQFSDQPIPKEVIENILLSASTAPSGAHKQPWTFCVISNTKLKSKIKEAAEKEEYDNYHGRMSDEWLEDLKPFQTDWHKPFIEIAPYIIIVFKKPYDLNEDRNKQNNYYVNESVGLATGFLLAAIHNAGLVALTHTPSPMNFLTNLLERPDNERAVFLIPVGYPTKNTFVPKLSRKNLDDIAIFYD